MYGANIAVLEAAAKSGKDVPALRNRPEITATLFPALDCWNDLQGDIDWIRVRSWSKHHGIDFDWLFDVLRIADRALTEHRKKEEKVKKREPTRTVPAGIPYKPPTVDQQGNP